MKTVFKIGLAASALAFAACEKKEPEVEVVSPVCPTDQILTDISSYSTELADANLAEAEFLAQNGNLDGIKTTPSGLQYRVNKSGPKNGPQPEPTNTVRVHYHGIFTNGSTFDSSYDRGEDIVFPLNRVIKGWTEGVGMMKPCDAWTFYIPSELAYGPNGSGTIPPKTPLVFHVQLIEVQ